MNLIPNFYPATAGTVFIDGMDVKQCTDASSADASGSADKASAEEEVIEEAEIIED